MPEDDKSDVNRILDTGGNLAYLTRCVALATLLVERGILEELLETGRLSEEEIDTRVVLLEERYPSFRGFRESANPGGGE